MTEERSWSFTRRRFLGTLGGLAAFSTAGSALLGTAASAERGPGPSRSPGATDWPSKADWNALAKEVGGRLVRVTPPLDACRPGASAAACEASLEAMKNPFYL
ncbi:MAG: FAD-linked oxidoreductase, partial [Myxococcota bacterium]|nr:FAD-linked oxidoreductase [Myxococcota bacterium]